LSALRELFASFFVDFDKEGALQKGDKQVEKTKEHVSSLGETLAEMGKALVTAFAVERIVEFGHALLEEADALAKQGKQLGISAQELQGWQHAAKLSGSSAEGIGVALRFLNKNIAEAVDGSKNQVDAFKAVGISAEDLKKKTPTEIFDLLADGLNSIPDPARRTQVSMALLGRSGAELIPLLAEGSTGMRALRGEVDELGAGFDKAFVDQAQEFNDNIDRLKLGLKGVAIQAIGPLLPDLVALSKAGIDVIKQFVGWIRHTKLIQTVLIGFGLKAVGGLITSIPVLIAKLGGWGGALVKLRNLALRTVLPFLALEDIIVFLAGGKSLLGEGLEKAFGKDKTEGFRQALLGLPDDVQKALNQMQDGVLLFVAFVQDAFDGLWNFISDGWRGTGKILGALGFEDAQKRIEQSNFAQKRAGGHVEGEQNREAVRNIKAAHDEAEKKQGKTLSLEDFIPQGAYTPERENQIRGALGLATKQTPGEKMARGDDWKAAYAQAVRGGTQLSPEQYVAQNAPKGTSDQDLKFLVSQLAGVTGEFGGIKNSLGLTGGTLKGAPIEISADAAQALGVTFAESTAAALQSMGPAALSSQIGAPQQVQQDITVRNQIQNTFTIPAGTDADMQRDIADSAATGSRRGIDTNKLAAALVPTPG
jgi:hypothetical protein